MEDKRINAEMQELEKILEFKFKKNSWLKKAMNSSVVKTPNKKNTDHKNEGLATVGDAVLKAVLADFIYKQGVTTDFGITEKKSKYENNKMLHKVVTNYKISDYAYNEKHFSKDKDIPDHEKVVDNEHDVYLEAIIAAMYFDSGYDEAKNWINNWLLPRLKKLSKKK